MTRQKQQLRAEFVAGIRTELCRGHILFQRIDRATILECYGHEMAAFFRELQEARRGAVEDPEKRQGQRSVK